MEKQEIKEHWTAAKFIRPNGSVLDFSGLYEVSDQGRVRSLRFGKTKIMKQATGNNPDGTIFYRLTMRKDNKRYQISVHRLVLSSFRPKGHRDGYFAGAIVNHKVERTPDSCINDLSNLEWLTQKDNTSTEHCSESKSKALTNRKDLSKRVRVTDLTTGEVIEYPSAKEAGRTLGINPTLVSVKILQQKGNYPKLGIHFAYID